MFPYPAILLIKLLLQMNAAMESCVGKTVVSGGMGFAFGGLIGLFMSSVRCALPLSVAMLG